MKRDASKEQFWREAIAEAGSSGQSAREFCGLKGLKESQFHSWRRTLRLRDAEAAGESGFVELVRSAAQPALAGVSIRVGERISIVLERGFDHEALRATLACLRPDERGLEARGEVGGP
jgi:transposase-like protein